ncbi:hypothetical protein HOC37_03220 [bacterium]|jgi:hypothetical protein|nr:hypothetical protein [bacterium]MBT3580972.1 hypothetical protein [bacterium]MBT4551978.1 hypothetical protein [bacterium]MBT7088229.1 hypothetical protein [bacterium]
MLKSVTGNSSVTPQRFESTRGDAPAPEKAAVAAPAEPTGDLAGYSKQQPSPSEYTPWVNRKQLSAEERIRAPKQLAPRPFSEQNDVEMRARQTKLEEGLGLQGRHADRGYGATPDAPRAPRRDTELTAPETVRKMQQRFEATMAEVETAPAADYASDTSMTSQI